MSTLLERSVIDDMKTLAAKYVSMFGRKPLGFVVGVGDMKALWKEIVHMGRSTGKVAMVTELDGLPVHLKMTSGIELLIDQDAALTVLSQEKPGDVFKMVKGAIVR